MWRVQLSVLRNHRCSCSDEKIRRAVKRSRDQAAIANHVRHIFDEVRTLR